MKNFASLVLMIFASASMVLAQAKFDAPFQVHYASNLLAGDSFVDITNSGASGGNICVNVYTFSPDEQEISCCSCTVTPNALVSLSVQNDLTSNTLTGVRPDSVVIKLLATSGTCGAAGVPSAGTTTTTDPLATGMLAWATTLHGSVQDSGAPSIPAIGGNATETPFSPATLSTSERNRITRLCSFIQANGSGFGICRSCEFGGMAPRQ